jgi:hypothetical protein
VSEATGNSVVTTAGAAGQDTGETDPAAGLSPGDQDDAVDIARAYFVAKTDFTGDQFDWKLEAAAKDNEGRWWVRVSATPKDDTSSDAVQIYVKRPPDMELWVAHGMSPDIDPATDKNMPDEVRDRLWFAAPPSGAPRFRLQSATYPMAQLPPERPLTRAQILPVHDAHPRSLDDGHWQETGRSRAAPLHRGGVSPSARLQPREP